MLKKPLAALAALLFLTLPGFGQDGHYDASLNAAAIFTKQTNGDGVTQSATNGAGGFASFRYRFNPRHSLVFTYGRTKNSQIFQTIDSFHVLTSLSEFSVAYMFNFYQGHKFEPFVLGGVGGLRFHPNSTWLFLPPLNDEPNNLELSLNTATQTELAVVYGFGADYKLPWHFALRMQYRGFLYKEPDFKIDTNAGSSLSLFTGARTNMAEPSVGLVFRF